MKPRFLILLVCIGLFCGCNRDPKAARDKYFKSAERYLSENKFDEAIIQYRNALQVDKGHIPSYLGMAKTFQKTGNHQNAIGIYQEVVKLDNRNKEARLQIGQYLLVGAVRNAELFKQAQEQAEAVLKLDPSNVEALILLSNAYAGQKDLDKSIELLQKVLALNPGNLSAALNLGAALMRKNEPDKAEAAFKEALQKHPDSTRAHLAMAAWLSAAKRPQEAETYLRKAFQLDPGDSASLYSLAAFYVSAKKPDEAEKVFKEAMAKKPDAREPRWGLAGFYLQQGMTDKGVAALQDLLKAHPGDRQAKLSLCELYLNQKNESKAEELIQSMIVAKKDDGEAHYLMGRLLLNRKEQDKAFSEFESAIKANKSLMPAQMEKTNLLLARGDLEGAQNTLNEILQLDRNNLAAKGALAKVLALRSRPQDALQQAQEVLATDVNNENALMARAESFRLTGKIEDSRKDFIKLTELHPKNALYWHRLGVVEVMKGESTAALQHFKKSLEIQPNYIPAANDILYVLLQSKKLDQALAELDGWSKLGGPQDEIHRFRGQIYLAKGDQASAEIEFRKTIEVNPRNNQTYLYLAQMKMQQKKIPEAIKEVDKLIAGNNKYMPAYMLKAYYLQVSKDIPGAIASYRKTLELDPENPIAANNLAWLLVENNLNLEEALSLAKTARKKRPEEPELADTLGWIYYRMKNYTLAIDQLLFSVNNRQQPRAESYYRLGLAYQAKGDALLAKQTLRKALEVNPSFPEAAEARKILAGIN
jgi:tetratricopeptide (TPR) repeat protein